MEHQFNLFDDDSGSMNENPPYQRHSDTSHQAAQEIEASASSLRGQVFRYLQSLRMGATDEEIQEALGMNPSTERPRRIELVERGLVTDSGVTRPTRSGRSAVVWRVA